MFQTEVWDVWEVPIDKAFTVIHCRKKRHLLVLLCCTTSGVIPPKIIIASLCASGKERRYALAVSVDLQALIVPLAS
jgi:hypothetical protein